MTKKPYFTLLFFILCISLNFSWAQTTSKVAEGASAIVDVVSGLSDQYFQMSQQQNQQYMQLLQQQQMLRQMTPQIAPPSATFPNCPLPAAGNPPQGMCSNIQGQDSFLMAQNLKNAAMQFSSSFDPYLSKSSTGVGLSCIDGSIKKLAQDISTKSNQLQAMIDNIKKGQQLLAEEASAIRKNMEGVANELYGGGGDVEEKTKDYTAFFPGCRGIIPSDALTNPKGGLVGIRNSIDNTGMRTAAQNLITNQGVYAKEIEELAERIKSDVNEVGIDTFFEGGATQSKWYRGGLTQFGGVEQIILEKKKEIDIKRARIAEDLAAVGYTAPRMDDKFRKKMEEFAGGATVYFQKKYINDCILGGNDKIKRLGLKPNELLDNIQHVKIRRTGVASSEYRNNLEAILNGPGFIDEKISRILDLDKIYGKDSFVVVYKNSSGNYSKETPINYFKSMMSVCETAYQSGGVLDRDTPGGSSYKEKVENAQKSLNELKQIELEFTGSLGNLLKDKLLNCSGSALKEGQCSPEIMTASNPEFCLKRGTFCAERTRACFTHADNLIKDRTAKLKALASIYNKKIETIVVNQEAELAKVKALVNNDINALRQMFPGATFTAPPDLVVALPAPVDTPLGVQLRGGGSMEFLRGLPEQLNKIKKSMEEHGKLAINEANQYLEDQAQQIQEYKKAWQDFAKECDNSLGEISKNYAEFMKKMMEEEQKLGSEVGEFCYKYDRLASSNPMAGCDGDNSPSKLYDDAFKVAGFINPSVISNLGEYEKLCAEAQNKPQLGTEGDKRPELIKLCEITGDNWGQVIEIKKQEVLRKISDPKLKARTKAFLDSNGDINPDLSNFPPPLFRQVTNIKQMESQKGDGKENLIKELDSGGKTKEEIRIEEVKIAISDMKKEMENFKFKNFKKELDKIEKNLNVKNLDLARKDLDGILASKEKFDKEVGTENSENLKKQLEDLEALSKSITKEEMDKLPEPPPSGLGSDHKDLFKKGDDENNLCLALKNQKVANAISDCGEQKNFENCFKRQIGMTADQVEPGIFDILNRKLSSISNFEDPEMIAERWTAIGEGGKASCTSQGSQGRRSKEPQKEGIDKALEDVQKVIEGKEI